MKNTQDQINPADINPYVASDGIQNEPDAYLEEPIKLIDFTKGFILNPKAIEMLCSIKEDIIVISVVGKARTGKSYLMNLLLDLIGTKAKDKGFKVAATLSSCTKGIWIWGAPRNSVNGDAKIVFLDSEGTSSTDKSTRTYDSRIFALVVLISSLFVFNTVSNIDEQGIGELSLAAHLSDAIQTNAGIDKDAILTELSPKFIWLIRDFALELIHPDTKLEITPKEYLELCLKDKKCGKNSNDNNLIRNNIMKFFPDRDCVTLVRPTQKESDLQNLATVEFKNLKPEFRMEFQKLKNKIFTEALPKKYNGKKLNGPALAQLIQDFVTTINNGQIPNINNSWDAIIDKDIKDYHDKSLFSYKSSLTKFKTVALEHESLVQSLIENKEEALALFDKLQQVNSDTFANQVYKKRFIEARDKLIEEIETTEQKVIDNNTHLSQTKCTNFLFKGFKEIEQKMFNNVYTMKHLNELSEDYNTFTGIYKENSVGNKKLEIFVDFAAKKEKEIIEYIVALYKRQYDAKYHNIQREIKLTQCSIEDMETAISTEKEKNKIYDDRVNNLARELLSHERDIQRLQETFTNNTKELETLKANQGIKYQPKKSTPVMTNEANTENIPNLRQERRQKESCTCKCTTF